MTHPRTHPNPPPLTTQHTLYLSLPPSLTLIPPPPSLTSITSPSPPLPFLSPPLTPLSPPLTSPSPPLPFPQVYEINDNDNEYSNDFETSNTNTSIDIVNQQQQHSSSHNHHKKTSSSSSSSSQQAAAASLPSSRTTPTPSNHATRETPNNNNNNNSSSGSPDRRGPGLGPGGGIKSVKVGGLTPSHTHRLSSFR